MIVIRDAKPPLRWHSATAVVVSPMLYRGQRSVQLLAAVRLVVHKAGPLRREPFLQVAAGLWIHTPVQSTDAESSTKSPGAAL